MPDFNKMFKEAMESDGLAPNMNGVPTMKGRTILASTENALGMSPAMTRGQLAQANTPNKNPFAKLQAEQPAKKAVYTKNQMTELDKWKGMK